MTGHISSQKGNHLFTEIVHDRFRVPLGARHDWGGLMS